MLANSDEAYGKRNHIPLYDLPSPLVSCGLFCATFQVLTVSFPAQMHRSSVFRSKILIGEKHISSPVMNTRLAWPLESIFTSNGKHGSLKERGIICFGRNENTKKNLKQQWNAVCLEYLVCKLTQHSVLLAFDRWPLTKALATIIQVRAHKTT